MYFINKFIGYINLKFILCLNIFDLILYKNKFSPVSNKFFECKNKNEKIKIFL